jgi:hypothetical protein
MPIDLTDGLQPAFEYFQAARPADPEMRDSATLWIIDQSGRLAFPRVTFDAIGESWDTPWAQVNFAHADGRTLRLWSQEPGSLGVGTDNKAAIRGAGPLRFECVEPFRRWTLAFDGEVPQSTAAQEIGGERYGTAIPLSCRFEAEMVVPPWLMGGMTPEAAATMQGDDAAALMGGVRYEQICRVKGTVDFAGEHHRIEGTGMRVRRQGVRRMGAATGHVQHSALFPSGRAFGAIAFAPGADGVQPFNEAFLYTPDGGKVPARIAQAPWMKRLVASSDDASLVLESEIGTVRIEGETLLTMFDHHFFEMADSSILAQGTARYVWDGEEAIGLLERCTRRDQLEAIGQ